MTFGEKLKNLREEKRVSQYKLTERLGHVSNSYISDVEKGSFIPSKEKLKKIAKAMRVSFRKIEDLLLESKIEELGVKEKDLVNLFKEIPRFPEKEKRKIIKVYLSVREKKRK